MVIIAEFQNLLNRINILIDILIVISISVSGSGRRIGNRGSCFLPVIDHVLQGNQDRYHDMLIFRTIDIDTVLVMQRDQFLTNQCNDGMVFIV